jgi:diguanylate cyclase (GGDEF)-like protein
MDEGSLSILVVEDDPLTADVLEAALRSVEHNVRCVATGEAALQALAQRWPDILMLDRMLPDVDGVELCARVRELNPGAPYLPILMLTALQSPEHKALAFARGADDYITKPFGVDELLARIRVWGRAARRVRELHELRQLYQESQHKALSDPLTGLYNRRGLEDVLEQETEKARRLGYWLGLLIIDVDHFKNVNDWQGHLEGDKALQAVARALRQALRKTDVLARFGGDEFVALLPGCEPDALPTVGEQLRQAVADLGSAGSALTVSIGGAVAPGHEADSIRLMTAADHAVYRAKADGRNRVVVAEQPVRASDPTTAPAGAARNGRPKTAMDRRRADPVLRDLVENAEPHLEQYGFHLDGRGTSLQRERSWVEFHRPDDGEVEEAEPGEDGETILKVGHRRRSRQVLVDAYHVDPDLVHTPHRKLIHTYDEEVPDVIGYVVDVAKSLPPAGDASTDGAPSDGANPTAAPDSPSPPRAEPA